MWKFKLIVLMFIFSIKAYSQDCIYDFSHVKWIEKRLELEKYNQNIADIERTSNKGITEERFVQYKVTLHDSTVVIYKNKGCENAETTLSINFGDEVNYNAILETTHLMAKLFLDGSNEKILQLDEPFLKSNKELIERGEILIVKTLPFESYDKHITTFQKVGDNYKVDIFTLMTYVVGD